MRGRKLKVVLLYNLSERLLKGEERDILAEDAILEEITAVEDAVRFLGHHCVVMAIRDEVFTTIHWLKEIGPDVVFNLCESVCGNTCWEMNIPAMLELFRIPYTGSSPLTLGLCQDKGKVKDILRSHGIRTPWYQIWDGGVLSPKEEAFPLIVKPLHEDGSLGISKESVVFDLQTLQRQVHYVVDKYRQPALIERFIDGRELNAGLIEINGSVEVLPISEIDYSEFPKGLPRICGYEAKWLTESDEYRKSKPICPAPLEERVRERVEGIALTVFRLFGCRDYARVDLRLDPRGRIYVLEVNPNPDISPQSGLARAIRVRGMSYPDFVGCLLEKALERSSSEQG